MRRIAQYTTKRLPILLTAILLSAQNLHAEGGVKALNAWALTMAFVILVAVNMVPVLIFLLTRHRDGKFIGLRIIAGIAFLLNFYFMATTSLSLLQYAIVFLLIASNLYFILYRIHHLDAGGD